MAAFNKFNQFVQDVCSGVHQLQTGTTHVLKVALTNTAPFATNSVIADITQLANANGYTTDGLTVGTITGVQTSGTMKVTGGTDPVFTASGAGFTARYAVLFNSTPTSPLKPLIGWWDYGIGFTLLAGETLTVDLDQANGLFTIA